ncbi:DUF1667 domain-containing protein [candidate division FCPU426 bacterium]|nr:DUF1667 domain-containing protein [candidate division FCPU426 bacterium]
MKKQLTCIECPNGCVLTAEVKNGRLLTVEGYQCPKGETYAKEEIESPRRTVTSTVRTEGLGIKWVPVRTNRPIPKASIGAAMQAIQRVRLTHPVRVGDVVVANLLSLGIDVVATRNSE